MTLRGFSLWAAFLGVLALLGRPAAASGALVIFVAASAGPAIEEIAQRFAADGAGTVRLSPGASSSLARQIEQGAPAHAFLSADVEWMEYLEQRRLLRANTRIDLLGNRLVLISPRSSPLQVEIGPRMELAAALRGRRLALADPEHVPAGRYAKAALETYQVWSELRLHVVRTDSVRGALTFVSSGEAAAGIVYASDVVDDKRVRVVGAFDPNSHTPIVYPFALISGREHPAASRFAAYLRSSAAREVFVRRGFVPLVPSS
ncbi:MAG: molybdate ABC transporter substrate-binding protein [Alphaproteobacteria bacterium]|nr:molybdate ABC transporter substrate-binding protein [Alphaproteobacteria bacterium]